MTDIERYFPVLFPILFIALWSLILWILSLISGWRRLADRYQYPADFQGELIRFQSAQINRVNFNGVLHLGISRQGLYLAPMVLFRLFHKPILIPWDDIIAEPFKRVLYRGYQLQFRSLPGIRLDFSLETFERILDALQAYPDALHLDNWHPPGK